ncbi:AraC-type DNA-binding protein [Marinobacter gudaonensis]|uniref:AraC-type DNA-binding protein n=1 Tax=Marinobacter gudaonensis TaxID=375760 RepID=A0A1I6HZJ9_9GAMM|nr:AraC family transcriptional regulator [Marinobacter gudaonensis]SFR59838.1 AraC-type DNA-binding protein [Marinobacter gudaonensis]
MGNQNSIIDKRSNVFSLAQPCIDNNTSIHWRVSGEYELHFFSGSQGSASIGNKVLNFSNESLFLIGPNLPHCWTVESSASQNGRTCHFYHRYVCFPEFKVVHPSQRQTALRQLETLMEEARYGIQFQDPAVISEVGSLMMNLDESSNCGLLGGLFGLLDLLISSKRSILNSQAFPEEVNDRSMHRINKAITYIKRNFRNGISLAKVSEVVSMSPSHFCRVFKKKYGVGFIDYLNKTRVENACELLHSSDDTVSSIAYECGFSHLSSFNRNFQKYVGQSPTNYRVQLKNSSKIKQSRTPGTSNRANRANSPEVFSNVAKLL